MIGVEYMVPRDVYDTFPEEERKLWHSHEYEVKSGMLILPKPAAMEDAEWEKAELAAMKEIINLYGKTWHFWEVDAGHEFPMGLLFYSTWLTVLADTYSISSGYPHLMGSVTRSDQVDLDEAMAMRNKAFGVHHAHKAEARKEIKEPTIADGK